MYRCEKCNTASKIKFGSGRFCSIKCSNSRIRTDEFKRKLSSKMTKLIITEKKCLNCDRVFMPNKHGQSFCTRNCAAKHRVAPRIDEIRETFRKSTIRRHQNNDPTIGWQSRNRLKPSYAEQFFMTVFDNESLTYQREVKFGRYFADFVINRVIVEIDGRRHDDDEIKNKDLKKDLFLQSLGYSVVRIKWSNPISKEYIKSSVEKIRSLM